jgi:undecaprenyl-phosphate 4-deoxy-4-formamido-L-arabinose transferase
MATLPDHAISVVVPAYRSARILPNLVEAIEGPLSQVAGPSGYELILVHDCGPDDTWERIVALAHARPWLRGIDLSRNAGQHNAIMAGLSVARGEYVVTMDDDLQHDPADIPRIVECLRQGADVCYVQFESRKHAAWKRLGSAFNDRVARWLLRKPAGLYLSPYRGLRRHVVKQMLRYTGPFVYVDGLVLQSTSNISTIRAKHHQRSDGESGYSLRKSISLWLQMATSFSVAPLRLASLAGIAFSIAGFLAAVVLVLQKLLDPATAVGWTSLIVVVLIIGGVQLLALGVIGEYVGRVLLNVANRPQFVVGRHVNLGDPEDGAEAGHDRDAHRTSRGK